MQIRRIAFFFFIAAVFLTTFDPAAISGKNIRYYCIRNKLRSIYNRVTYLCRETTHGNIPRLFIDT